MVEVGDFAHFQWPIWTIASCFDRWVLFSDGHYLPGRVTVQRVYPKPTGIIVKILDIKGIFVLHDFSMLDCRCDDIVDNDFT